MTGQWWTAIVTWTADDGTGAPKFAAWLYNASGTAVSPMSLTDPNVTAATTARFMSARASAGLALGGTRTSLSARNFDGLIATVRLYNAAINEPTARGLAEEMAITYTSAAAPE